MTLPAELCKVVQGSFNQGNARFKKIAGIQCACMALFTIWYLTIKEIGPREQLDLDIVLVNGDSSSKTLRSQTL